MAIPRSNTTVTLTETTIDLNDVPQERAATHRNFEPPEDARRASRLHEFIYSNWENISFWFNSSVLSIKTMGSIVCLIASTNMVCDKPLRGFIIVFCISSGLTLISNVFRYQYKRRLHEEALSAINVPLEQTGAHNANPLRTSVQPERISRLPDNSQEAQRVLSYLEKSKGLLEAFALLWLFFGSTWLFSCETCQKTAPLLFYWSFVCVAYGYIFICAPLVFFSTIVCLVPAALLIVKRIKQAKLERAARKILKTIPLVPYQSVYEEKYGAREEGEPGSATTVDSNIDCCSICLAGFKWKERVRKLACKHYFHSQCGDKWLVAHGTCPLCLSSIRHAQS